MQYKVVIGTDPGNLGGISIFKDGVMAVCPMPTMNKVVNKKNKKVYDLDRIVRLLSKYRNEKVIFCLESQNPRPFEGSISSFSSGRGYGMLMGVAVALGFDVIEVRPATWKKHFQLLSTESMESKKEELSALRKKGKTLKGKREKEANNKEMEKLARQIKSEGKKSSIDLVKKMYPTIDIHPKKTDSDGMAEAVLIAQYGFDCQNSLIST